MPSGSEFVSTRAIIGIPIFWASSTAILSCLISITKRASGNPFISLIPPTQASSFAYSFWISTASFLINFSILPDEIISSMSCNLLIDPLIVFQLVSVPPSHLLLIYGNPMLDASSLIVLLADLLVPTNKTLLPFEQISSTFEAAALKCSWVKSRFIMLIFFLVSKIYWSIFGFQNLCWWPKWTPAWSRSFTETILIVILQGLFSSPKQS